MAESVILTLPIVLAGYGLALLLLLTDFIRKPAGGALRFASAFLAVGATAWGLLMGVSLSEAALALTVFLLLNMGARK